MKKIKGKVILFGILFILVIGFIVAYFNFNNNSSSTYTVTFDSDGGSPIASVKANKDEIINLRSTIKEGFVFDGWVDEDGNKVSNEYVVTRDAKLKATWVTESLEIITVKFDSNGGSKVNDIFVLKGNTLKLPKNPTRDGYTFKVWVDKNDVPIYDDALLSEDTILKAVWEKN